MIRGKMDRQDRAKQFMPFAALKGYEEALRQKEKILVDKIELSEERKEELDYKLRQIQKNMIITVVYYEEKEYIQITGMVSRIDGDAGLIKIVNKKIAFSDIYDIQIN